MGFVHELDHTQADGLHLVVDHLVHGSRSRPKSDVFAGVAPVEGPLSPAYTEMRVLAVQTPLMVGVPPEARRPCMKLRVKAVRTTVERVAACADFPELAGKNVAI